MALYRSILDAFGNTPLVRLNNIVTGLKPEIYVKLEYYNPGGSVKDRPALKMIRTAEAQGLLKPGGIVVESTSGNTGIGLTVVAQLLGYRSVVFIPANTAVEKIKLLRTYGAEVRLVEGFPPPTHPNHIAMQAEHFSQVTPGAWYAHQYDNSANPLSHYESTGPEIWADTAGRVTHLVASVGTGGTITGTGRYLKEQSQGKVTVIGADLTASAYTGGPGTPKFIEGAGRVIHPSGIEKPWPQALDPKVIDQFIAISDREAIHTIHRVVNEEGLFLGGSSGLVVAAALKLAETLDRASLIVAIAPDSGRSYLSTYFDETWLLNQGFNQVQIETGSTLVQAVVEEFSESSAITALSKQQRVAEVLQTLETINFAEEYPVFITEARHHLAKRIPPAETLGVVTRGQLRRLLATGTNTAQDNILDVVSPVPPSVGFGTEIQQVVHKLENSQPNWRYLAVLIDGWIASVLNRNQIEAFLRKSTSA